MSSAQSLMQTGSENYPDTVRKKMYTLTQHFYETSGLVLSSAHRRMWYILRPARAVLNLVRLFETINIRATSED